MPPGAEPEDVDVEDDLDLWTAFARGDQDAFERVFRRFQGEVYRWILRIVRDRAAAEDVLVDAFWRAYRARARFDPGRSFGAWMRRIATNAAIDHLKSRAPERAWVTADDSLASRPASDLATRESLALAFRRLPPKLQVVAALALIEERPYQEIADALDLPLGTVKSRVFRAVQALRKELARMGLGS